MKSRRLIALSVVVLASVAVAAASERWGNLTRVRELERKTLGWRQIAVSEDRSAGPQESPIVLVFFDEAATDEWPYLSPYPRAFLAELVAAFDEAGARTIGLDVYLERRFPRLNRSDRGDERLREAMGAAGSVVVVAPLARTDSGRVLRRPTPYFGEAAAGVGAAEFPTAFETVDEGLLAVRTGRGIEPSFALALYASFRGLETDSILGAAERSGVLELPGLPPEVARLPPSWRGNAQGREEVDLLTFPVRFVGPPSSGELPGTFPSYRASEAVSLARFAPEFFRDRIVMVGTGFHDSDKFRTPWYGYFPPPDAAEGSARGESYSWMYGVEVHANALQNILDGTWVRLLGPWGVSTLLLAVAALTGMGVFLRGAAWGGAAAGTAAALAWASAYWAWDGSLSLPVAGELFALGPGYVWVPMVTPLVAVLCAYLGSTAYVSIVEGREKRFIRGAFGKYVPPAVVDEISQNPAALRLGGEERTITVLFCDVAGFTSLAESLDPEEVLALLNEYLSAMTALVMQEEGTLDKYIGDAIMAFWNAPKSQPDHADRALRAAVLMQREIGRLNRRRRDEDPAAPALSVRIGLNTGRAVVGNVGGEDRFDYSAIGDPVNLAARLEPANKSYGTRTMASELTLEAADRGAYRVRELDLVAVKGRREPVKVFEVLEIAGEALEPSLEEALPHFDAGLAAYRSRDWELAAEYFSAALEAHPGDGPSRVYLERSRQHESDPPPADWDFVVRRTVK